MPIMRLDHFFVRANDLEVTRAFYCEVLGFVVSGLTNKEIARRLGYRGA